MQPLSVVEHIKPVLMARLVPLESQALLAAGIRGVGKDYAEALKWQHKAVAQGNAVAQNNLGLMYGKGEGVPQNSVTAYAWFNIAAANGSTKGKSNKDVAAKQLTPAQIIQAQALSRDRKSTRLNSSH